MKTSRTQVEDKAIENFVWSEQGYGEGPDVRLLSQVTERLPRMRGLFAAGAIAVAAGLVSPLPGTLADVMLVFVMCLTAAVVVTWACAREARQVQSFALFVVLVTMLRMGLSVGTAKVILVEGNSGLVARGVGRMVLSVGTSAAAWAFIVLVLAGFLVICRAVRSITRMSVGFGTEVLAYKTLSIENRREAHSLSDVQADALHDEALHEAGFFSAMGGAAGFLLCAAVIELVVTCFNMAMSAASGIAAGMCLSSSLGVGIVLQSCSVATVLAASGMVRKSLRSAAAEVDGGQTAGTDAEGSIGEETGSERVQDSTVKRRAGGEAESGKTGECSFNDNSSLEFRLARASIGIVQEPINAEFIDIAEAGWEDAGTDAMQRAAGNGRRFKMSRLSEEYYDAIMGLIEGGYSDNGGRANTVVMAAEHVAGLPVTIPVHIAMRFAQKNRKCLLMDLDVGRNALMKVFDLDATAAGQRREAEFGLATCIKNLWVWPASSISKSNGKIDARYVRDVILGLASRYDDLIVYAPNLKVVADWESVGDWVKTAVLFDDGSEDGEELVTLQKVLAGTGCKIVRASETVSVAK